MSRIIHFKCPGCETEVETAPLTLDRLECPACSRKLDLRPTAVVRSGDMVDACAACGHDNLYIQKDFNRTLGLTIVVVGVLFSLFFFARNAPAYAMLALVGMAAIDGLIYLVVGEVTVCYACHAIYRGFGPNPAHAPFDLEMLEKYGGRDPRY